MKIDTDKIELLSDDQVNDLNNLFTREAANRNKERLEQVKFIPRCEWFTGDSHDIIPNYCDINFASRLRVAFKTQRTMLLVYNGKSWLILRNWRILTYSLIQERWYEPKHPPVKIRSWCEAAV